MNMQDIIPAAAEALAHLRERKPKVHVITNSVVQGFTANVLLAAGAVPSMTTAAAEIADFVAGADARGLSCGARRAKREARKAGSIREDQIP